MARIRDPTSSPWDILGSPSRFHSHKSTCRKFVVYPEGRLPCGTFPQPKRAVCFEKRNACSSGSFYFFFIFENEKNSASALYRLIPWEGPLVQGCPTPRALPLRLHIPMERVHKIRRLTKKASSRNILMVSKFLVQTEKEAMRVKSQNRRYGRRHFKDFVPGYFDMVCLGDC